MLGFLSQTFFDDAFHRQRDARPESRQRLWIFVQNSVDNRLFILAGEWVRASHHFVQHHAQGPDIGAQVYLLSTRLFGTHVGDCPER